MTYFRFLAGFVETPSTLDGMTQHELVLAIGENAVFGCQHCQSDSIRWRLNGTLINNLIPDVTRTYNLSYCGILYSLKITKIESYNKTTIQCEADVGGSSIPTEAVLLLVQGNYRLILDTKSVQLLLGVV